MKIYFAGSIRGGRVNQESYSHIIDCLHNYGNVLTEHVGNFYLKESGEQNLSDEMIYERDLEWLKQADVLIAEVSTPSLGVGYEISRAEEFKKPILCLYQKHSGKCLSAMISGNRRLEIAVYSNFDEIAQHIKIFFSRL